MHKKTNKYTNYSFSLLIIYGSSHMFRGRVVSCDVVHAPLHWTQHIHPQYSIDCTSIEHLSEGTRNAP
jgi:hypothetical protein